MFSCEFCGIFKNTFVIKLFQATLQVHKVDKNVSRYYNKDIKVIPVEPILVTLCQLWKWFSMLRKLWKPTSRKTYQNLKYFFIFAVHNNFTYDFEAYYLMKLYFKTLLEILVSFASLRGSPELNSKVLTIRPLIHVRCGCYKTISQWTFWYCTDVGVTLSLISQWRCWYIVNETHDDVNLRYQPDIKILRLDQSNFNVVMTSSR